MLLLISATGWAQEIGISGKVLDEDKIPLPGVTVRVKDASLGAVTDFDGNFTLFIPNSDVVLVFSSVGFKKQELRVRDKREFIVTMAVDRESLDEVVVTALGIKQEKKALGYAVTEVKGETVAQTQRENFINALAGRIPGVEINSTSGLPGASTSMVIRGISSLSGSNQPLFVVDGLPISNSTTSTGVFASSLNSGTALNNRGVDFTNRVADINPEDIENITILKGPEASALYGIEAASGAVVITGGIDNFSLVCSRKRIDSFLYLFLLFNIVRCLFNFMKTTISYSTAVLVIFSLLFFSCKTQQTLQSSTPKNQPEVVEPPMPVEEKEEEPDTTKPAEVTKEELPEEVTIEEEIIKSDPPIDVAEFRAAWIATVANINWPSRSGLPTAQQQGEAIKLLDFLANHNYNAVIFQVRPQADALYQSDIESWSYFLTGQQGKAPQPFYDPLTFWINEAHKRGMELHVWLNPYRAYHTTGGEIGAASVVKTNPEMVVKLQNGMYWMDPARKDVQDRTAAVVEDLVKRYDVDGIHFDDYFYPYDSYNGGKDFPDDQTWNTYRNAGGKLTRGDWRRKNVDDFIARVAKVVKKEKNFVKFGISPFGIWRPGYPQSIAGYDQYEKLYADAKKWINEGWVDYLTPQLYWKTDQIAQSFPVLLHWWESENIKDRHIWPGINAGLIEEEGYENELFNQLMITRGMLADDPGAVLWNLKALMNDKETEKALAENYFRKPALVPSSPWMDNKAPKSPEVFTQLDGNTLRISWEHPDQNDVFRWVLYFQYEGSKWDFKILNKAQFSELKTTLSYLVGEKKIKLSKIGMTAVDRTGNQSDFKEIILE